MIHEPSSSTDLFLSNRFFYFDHNDTPEVLCLLLGSSIKFTSMEVHNYNHTQGCV
jgi:hypothetical protein